MLSPTEEKILELLFDDLTKEYTIRGISLLLKLPYPQIHRSIGSLSKKKLIKLDAKGRSLMVSPFPEQFHEEYLMIELSRRKKLLEKYKLIKILDEDLKKVHYTQFCCVLFGSYASGKISNSSDIDLLFIIPEEYDYALFEKSIKSTLTLSNLDINITKENGLLEMWRTPLKLNVGNELLKKHVILQGVESFWRLRRRHYVG